jgi:hypothetical protein
MPGTKQEAQAIEAQAIGRAHRQGQNRQVTIVRFIIRNTIEHDTYIKNYVQTEEGEVKKDDTRPRPQLTRTLSGRPKMVRSTSVGTVLANAPATAQTSAAVLDLVEKDNA